MTSGWCWTYSGLALGQSVLSHSTSLKSGISGARIGFLPPGAKGSDGGDCPLGGRDGRCFHFFFFLLVLSWSLQKEGCKYQTILPYLVARAMCVGKRKALPLPCPMIYVRLVQKESRCLQLFLTFDTAGVGEWVFCTVCCREWLGKKQYRMRHRLRDLLSCFVLSWWALGILWAYTPAAGSLQGPGLY